MSLESPQANKELTDHAPWSPNTPVDTAVTIQTWLRETLRVCGILLQPFMPGKAGELLNALSVDPKERTWAHAEIGRGARDPGPLEWVSLFPGPQQRQKLEVEKDHAGTVIAPEYHSQHWQKAQ